MSIRSALSNKLAEYKQDEYGRSALRNAFYTACLGITGAGSSAVVYETIAANGGSSFSPVVALVGIFGFATSLAVGFQTAPEASYNFQRHEALASIQKRRKAQGIDNKFLENDLTADIRRIHGYAVK